MISRLAHARFTVSDLHRSLASWVIDPDGNRIELRAYTPESWQAPWLR